MATTERSATPLATATHGDTKETAKQRAAVRLLDPLARSTWRQRISQRCVLHDRTALEAQALSDSHRLTLVANGGDRRSQR